MTWLRVLVLRLLALFRKGRLDQRKGMSPREARYAALRSFGGVEQVKEVYREQRGLPMIETLIQDLRYGLRMMLKNRGFSVTALVSLSLGIGCTVTVFTFVDAVLIRKLPVRSPEQLVAIGAPGKNLNLNPSYFSHALYQHLRDSQPLSLELIASSVAVSSGVNLRLGEMTERVRVELVSGNYFEVLGVSAAIGRVLSQKDDERPGAHPVAVLSHAFWQRRFGGVTEAVGQTMAFNGHPLMVKRIGHGQSGPADIEIVGVVKDAKYLSVREAPLRIVYFPFHQSSPMTLHVRTSTDAKMMIPIIRGESHALDPNVPLFHIQTMAMRIDDSLREERLVFRLGSMLGVLGTLLAAVGLYGVLSYGVIQRSREIGIRMALGAQRADVLGMAWRQGMKLAWVGIVIGMMGALVLTKLLRSMLFGVSPADPLTFAAVTLLLGGVALLASWLPARRAAKVDPIVVLRSE